MASTRRDEIFRAIEALASIHHDWLTSDDKEVTLRLYQQIDDTLGVVALGDVPAECRKLCAAADRVAEQWQDFYLSVTDDDRTEISPPAELLAALVNLYDQRKEAEYREPPPIEPIEQLEKQKLTDKQICCVYDWWLSPGVEDIGKLQEERKKPGMHTGKGFVHPMIRRRQAEEAACKAAREEFHRMQREKLKRLNEPNDPRPMVELVNEGLSARQIAKLKNITADAVMRECNRLGIAPPPMDYQDARTERAPSEPSVPESIQRIMHAEQARPTRPTAAGEPVPEMASGTRPIEDRILNLAADGLDAPAIAKALQAEGTNISERRILAIMRQFGEPAAS